MVTLNFYKINNKSYWLVVVKALRSVLPLLDDILRFSELTFKSHYIISRCPKMKLVEILSRAMAYFYI